MILAHGNAPDEPTMIYVIAGLTILLGIAYGTYRTAKTESVGFKALVAWIALAILDVTALIVWAILSLVQSQ